MLHVSDFHIVSVVYIFFMDYYELNIQQVICMYMFLEH